MGRKAVDNLSSMLEALASRVSAHEQFAGMSAQIRTSAQLLTMASSKFEEYEEPPGVGQIIANVHELEGRINDPNWLKLDDSKLNELIRDLGEVVRQVANLLATYFVYSNLVYANQVTHHTTLLSELRAELDTLQKSTQNQLSETKQLLQETNENVKTVEEERKLLLEGQAAKAGNFFAKDYNSAALANGAYATLSSLITLLVGIYFLTMLASQLSKVQAASSFKLDRLLTLAPTTATLLAIIGAGWAMTKHFLSLSSSYRQKHLILSTLDRMRLMFPSLIREETLTIIMTTLFASEPSIFSKESSDSEVIKLLTNQLLQPKKD